ATTEVKGFALILAIGICATLFTALFVTRVIYTLYTELFGFRRLAMLPTVIPAVHRALEPAINWMRLRKVFWTLSVIGIIISISLIGARGVNLLDTEFRGGVAVTMLTAPVDADRDGEPDATDEAGDPVRQWLAETGPGGVEERVHALGGLLEATADANKRRRFLSGLHSVGVLDRGPDQIGDPADEPALADVQAILDEVAKASVLTVGATEVREGVVYAPSFQVKVASPRGLGEERTITDVVVTAVVTEFGDLLDVTRPLNFRGTDDADHTPYTFPVEDDQLGENIGQPRYTDLVTRYLGGVAVVVDDIDPPVTTLDVAKRIDRMRAQPDFASYVGREEAVFGLEAADPANPDLGYRSVAVLVHEPEGVSYFDDLDVWDRELAAVEWQVVSQALRRQTSLEQVSSFSSAVAATLSANAIVAVTLTLLGILVYIWVRFGSLRYSLAAIVALVHDVTLSLGVLSLTAWVAGSALAAILRVEEFRIDLGVVAALLTIIGYSLNDTIVILDRIRENRGKLPIPTVGIVNRSINQTISRTVLTSFTTLLAVGIMFGAGGSGIRPFAFTLLVGLIVGTYSSVAIAAPLVVRGGFDGAGRGAPGDEAKTGEIWTREKADEDRDTIAAAREAST
ncbi:MAG: protein translocase subunit SecF, partial [Planctomycetota bacterium]